MHRAGGYFMLAISYIQIWTGLFMYSNAYQLDARIIPTFFSLAMAGIVSVQLSAEGLGKQELTDALEAHLVGPLRKAAASPSAAGEKKKGTKAAKRGSPPPSPGGAAARGGGGSDDTNGGSDGGWETASPPGPARRSTEP